MPVCRGLTDMRVSIPVAIPPPPHNHDDTQTYRARLLPQLPPEPQARPSPFLLVPTHSLHFVLAQAALVLIRRARRAELFTRKAAAWREGHRPSRRQIIHVSHKALVGPRPAVPIPPTHRLFIPHTAHNNLGQMRLAAAQMPAHPALHTGGVRKGLEDGHKGGSDSAAGRCWAPALTAPLDDHCDCRQKRRGRCGYGGFGFVTLWRHSPVDMRKRGRLEMLRHKGNERVLLCVCTGSDGGASRRCGVGRRRQ